MTIALLAAAGAAAALLQSAVSQVTVFSDRARVVRTAEAPAGAARVEFPLLPDSVDPSSIRVEATDLQRIDIAHVEPDAFPADEARGLLEKLEKLDDRIALLGGEREDDRQQLEALRKIAPQLPGESLKPRPKLNPRGWTAGMSFERTLQQECDARIRERTQQLDELGREREKLAAQARLLGGARRRSGFRVTAFLAGAHGGPLTLTYLVRNAGWTPLYDLQLLKDQKSVRVTFTGAVAQETGEDWTSAQLTLSTAIPATARALPEIATWKLGDRERFIPQSFRTNPPAPLQRLVWPPPPPPPEDASSRLRQELLARAEAAPEEEEHKDVAGRPETGVALMSRARAAMPMQAPAAAMSGPPPAPPAEDDGARTEPKEMKSAQDEELGADGREGNQPVVAALRGKAPESGVGIAPPPAWIAPRPPPGSPAEAAGGYELEYNSVQRETIQTGKGVRRVVLFSETWPVQAERVLYPGVAADAYLIARIKNPSQRVLPRALAQLTVGQDLAGHAQVPLSLPGVEVELPLGLDRAIHPQRNVAQVQGEQGLFSKDEITRYLVTIEIANPYAAPISLRVIDQVPLTGDNHMDVELLEAPRAEVDRATGKLTWTLTVQPAEKVKLAFTYQLKRPKGFRVHQ
jgi:hypothetical protein